MLDAFVHLCKRTFGVCVCVGRSGQSVDPVIVIRDFILEREVGKRKKKMNNGLSDVRITDISN